MGAKGGREPFLLDKAIFFRLKSSFFFPSKGLFGSLNVQGGMGMLVIILTLPSPVLVLCEILLAGRVCVFNCCLDGLNSTLLFHPSAGFPLRGLKRDRNRQDLCASPLPAGVLGFSHLGMHPAAGMLWKVRLFRTQKPTIRATSCEILLFARAAREGEWKKKYKSEKHF